MAGASHVARSTFLDALKGARLADRLVMGAVGRTNEFPEFVVETSFAEITFFLSNPFLQAKMRLDHEFGHCFLRSGLVVVEQHFHSIFCRQALSRLKWPGGSIRELPENLPSRRILQRATIRREGCGPPGPCIRSIHANTCAVRPPLGRDRASSLPPFRTLLLPGHRLRDRPQSAACRGRRA